MVAFAIVMVAMTGMVIPAYAGGINGAESRVIAYYNKRFYSNGKAYVATDGAKSRAYAKLSEDKVDLTEAQADEMILQISANVERGIKEGYLVEIDRNGEKKEEKQEPKQEETEKKNTQTTEKAPESDKGSGEENKKENNTERGSEHTSTDPINNNTNTEKNSGSGGSSDNGNTGGEANSGGSSAAGDGAQTSSKASVNENRKKINTGELVKELKKRGSGSDKKALSIVDNEGNPISAEEVEKQLKKGPVTIRDYTEGVVRIVDKEGTVLYDSTLPVRNTGLKSDYWFLIPLILVVGLLLLGAFCFIRPTVDIHWAVGGAILAGISLAAVFFGGRNAILSYTSSWERAWISNAPEYKYQENDQTDVKPEMAKAVLHEQYGSLHCVNINLTVPIYYGDGDQEFEQGAGIYPGYTLPGEKGTTLIGGHDGTYFAPLENISQGDVIEVDCINGTHYYSVTGTAAADASDESKYGMTEDEDKLILYTCYPFGKATSDRSKRFYVYAEKMETGEGSGS